MKPEALDAMAGHTMRPNALEAATEPTPDASTAQVDGTTPREDTPQHPEDHSTRPEKPTTPFGQRIDGTESAAKVVEELVHGVKVAVDGAIAWVEKKAEALSSESDNNGPYTSPATCAPSDLDPIASGVLPAMSPPKKNVEEESTKKHNDEEEGMRKGRNLENDDGKEDRGGPL